ncbi:5-methylcytosine methyltransferase [Neisseria gonorrhoeae]|uniref:5-methylcytosine methyltransferase n=1 Tax=Neisseria gonorrhoeae TaxID=485 RepID=A0A378W279_NEIGO|nr:5-methylcytosine methyltransferase [Neisseria gonorrhoeae]
MHTPLTYIDLFSGAGGLSLGLNKPDSNNCFLLKWSLIIVRLTVPTSPVINYCKRFNHTNRTRFNQLS